MTRIQADHNEQPARRRPSLKKQSSLKDVLTPTDIRTWRAVLIVWHEMLLASGVAALIAVLTATLYTWATPFADDPSAHALDGLTLSVVAWITVVGGLSSCPLVTMMVRDQTGTTTAPSGITWKHVRLTARLSWRALLVGPLLAVGVTALLLWRGVRVAQYNLHSLVACVVVQVLSVRLALNLLATSSARAGKSLNIQVAPSPQPPSWVSSFDASSSSTLPVAAAMKWRQVVKQVCNISVPATLSAVATVQFITVARHVAMDSVASFVWFAVACASLKAATTMLTRLFVLHQKLPNIRSAFFTIVAPALHVEIQQRMALFRAQRTTPVYAASALLGVLEVALRMATLLFDTAVIRRRWRQLNATVLSLQAESVDKTASAQRMRIAQLHADFSRWRAAHLRMCAAEVLAEMAAEYCGMALVAVGVMVLRGNASIDLAESGEVAVQLQSWGVQVLLEMATDVVAVAMELRLGLPLIDVLVADQFKFMRWVVVVIVVHASGLCLSSLIVERAPRTD